MGRTMRESGVTWIGQIPNNFKLTRLKFAASLKGRIGWQGLKASEFTENGPYLITGTDFNNGIINWETCAHISKERFEQDKAIHIKENDLLITKDGTIGKVAVAKNCPLEVSLNGGVLIIRNDRTVKYDPRFLYYVLNSNEFTDWFDISDVGNSTIKHLTQDKFYNFLFAYPEIQEQKRIAGYLDSRTKEANRVITQIQSEISILESYKRSVITEAVTKGLDENGEMKDSHIFYLGPINSRWHLSKIGYICTKLQRNFSSEDIPLICTNKGTVEPRGNDVVGKMASEDNAMQGINIGDIAIHGMDTWHGAIALSKFSGKITRVVHVCDSTEDKRFVVYYLQSLAYRNVYKVISNGVRGNTSDFRSWPKVKDIWIPLPDRIDQQRICDYVDMKCQKINQAVALKKKQLEALDKYKQSLIYEYVTGKKEVS